MSLHVDAQDGAQQNGGGILREEAEAQIQQTTAEGHPRQFPPHGIFSNSGHPPQFSKPNPFNFPSSHLSLLPDPGSTTSQHRESSNTLAQINTQSDGPNYRHGSSQTVLITPTSSNFDPNYSVTSPLENELRERRLSLQLPPYQHQQLLQQQQQQHMKKDSYDSQTSLSQLADIASSNFVEEDTHRSKHLISELVRTLQDFVRLNQIVNDINADFQFQLRNSQTNGFAVDPSSRLSVDNQKFISVQNFETFVKNIPLAALYDSINITTNIQNFFNNWLHVRKMEEVREYQEQKAQKHIKKEEEDLRRKRIEESEQQDKSPKKHKSFFPFKPTTTAAASAADVPQGIPQKLNNNSSLENPQELKAGGVLNEDLSLKQDHSCQQCGSNDTPEWRRGPYGSRSLCNACGLFYGKLIKKFGFEEAATLMVKRKEEGNGEDRRIPID